MRTFVAALISAAALTGLASANDSSADVITIRLHPSDLVRAERVEELRSDIRRAANRVCELRRAAPLEVRRQARACVSAAVEDAEAQLNIAVAQASGVIEVARVR